MWTYSQKTGELRHNDAFIGKGYSGRDEGKNNPQMQAVRDLGPIPGGDWIIVGPPANSCDHGPYVLRLQPAATTKTFGRSGFLLHGDSIESPGCASHGCIILARTLREQVWESEDHDLQVVTEFASKLSPSQTGI